ncbi:MAG TPA: aminomethyl-transferring glycine dehydrogenase subunit GcvPA [Pseudoflavonifractor sp.]|nr:aminomethyl-transferring glycine dehydrogenase subunit GcvPA [Pseudoflavonifractor sp.]
MGTYIPSTAGQREEMLRTVGLNSMEELYDVIPGSIRLSGKDAAPGMSELEAAAALRRMAAKNRVFGSIFRGAGAYDHYIPAAVKRVTAKEEFVTAYTPYQAEISQGVLQSIFEYQTMICELTGMDASNASMYDGASAAGEAAAMCRERRRERVLISGAANPMVIRTIKTYCEGVNAAVEIIPVKDGKTDLDALKAMLRDTDAGVYLQQPNYFGMLEDAGAVGELTHAAGAKFIMGVNPIAAAILKTPRACGADIAVGEGQPLGMALGFGGPYLGFMAATQELQRRLPGRIAGETTDGRGNRCFVLTLQAREQHIRREKASSNVCTNQALCAMTAAVYMAAMGPQGLRQAAEQSYSKAHYLAAELEKVKGFTRLNQGEFFHEFVMTCPVPAKELLARLEREDILGGLPVEGGILWCCTEKNSRADMDRVAAIAKEVAGV